MRRVRHTALLLGVLLIAAASRAQSAIDDLPRPSQHAEVVQRIGVTNITINYSRPLVSGRKVLAASKLTEKSGAPARMRTRRSRSAIPS